MPDPESESRPRALKGALPAVVFLVALISLIADSFSINHFPLDDAWIHQVYARSLASGDGMAYNPGSQEAGSTSPLWSLITAPAHWVAPLPEVLGVKMIGCLLGLYFVLSITRIATRLTESTWTGIVAGSLVALDPRLAFAALSGMEPILLVALVAGACRAHLAGRPWIALLCFSLMPVTRPEAALFLPLALPIWWSIVRSAPWPRRLAATVLPGLPGALWVAFCLAVTGRPLPNTFYLKARPFSLDLEKVDIAVQSLTLSGPFPFWLCLLGLAASTWLCYRKKEIAWATWGLLTAVPVVFLLAVLGSRTVHLVGYYWTRWLDPATLPLTAGAAIGLAFLAVSALPALPALTRSRPAVIASLATAILISVSVGTWCESFSDRRFHLSSDSRVIALLNVRLGLWVAEHVPEDAVVGVNDAGALRYFSDRYCIDLLGLNSADIAFGRLDTRQAIDRSDWLVIFPSWFARRRLLGHIQESFIPRVEARIPMEEFSLFDSPGQTAKVALERRPAPSLPTPQSQGTGN